MVQPTVIPGEWDLRKNPLPPLSEILDKPAQARPIYGLYGWCGEYENHRENILKVGFRSYRIGGPMYDKTMVMLVEDDMEAMKTLDNRIFDKTKKTTRDDFETDEVYIEAYLKGVERFMERYGPNGSFFKDYPDLPHRPIMYIEIFNEPNFQYIMPRSETMTKARQLPHKISIYARMLAGSCKLIKERWPEVTVVGFAMGSTGDAPFIEKLYKYDEIVGKSYDVLSTHPYSKPNPPESFIIKPWPSGGHALARNIDNIRNTMRTLGSGVKPVWYTEVGWPILPEDGGYYSPPQAKKPMISAQLQAAYICRLFAFSMRLGVDRVHIMHVIDADRFNGGVFTREGEWRQASYAIKHMIDLMPNPKLVAAVYDGCNGLYAYQFDPDYTDGVEQKVLMAWNVDGPKTVALPVAGLGTKTVFDMFGNTKQAKVVDGKVEAEVGPCPIYITTSK